jgi:L-amino acid N-acyltransferase YncA
VTITSRGSRFAKTREREALANLCEPPEKMSKDLDQEVGAGLLVKVTIGGISLPNDASVALHEKYGFQKVAYFKEVGRKFDKWIDAGYWQLVL